MAKRSIIDLIKQSGIYALGNVAIKLSGLALVPMYLNTTYLSLTQYGQFATLVIFANICIGMVGLGLGAGMLRYVGKEDDKEKREALPFTAMVSTIVIAGLFCFLIWHIASPLAGYFLSDASQYQALQFLGMYVACKVIASVPMMLLRIQERPGMYVLMVIVEMGLLIGGVLHFLAGKGMGITGVFLAFACASGIQAILLVVLTTIRVKWQFDMALVKPAIMFGGPLILMSLAGQVLNAGDRFILKELSTDMVVGKYDWAARLSGILNLFVVHSFQLAFTVLGLKTLGDGDLSLHRRSFRHFSIWSGWAVLGISLLAYDLTVLLKNVGVDDYYVQSTLYVFPLALGAMLYGIFIVINNVFYAKAKTRVMTQLVIVAAVVNIVLNIALIPWFEALGAAIATVLSFGLLVFLANRKAGQEIDIHYGWTTFFKVVAMILVLFAIGFQTQDWQTGPRLIARIGVVALYFPLLFIFKIYTMDEVKQGWQFLQKKMG